MPKRWRIRPHDQVAIAELQSSAGIPPVVAQLLVGRGIREAEEAKLFLEPKLTGLRDPDLLPGNTLAAEIIWGAIQAKSRIVVYGDYDADGMTATAILVRCLRLLNADVHYYVPNRIDEGYSLNEEAIRSLAEQKTDLIVTVDCGVASLEEADLAAELGMTLIVTDHHQAASSMPRAAAVVHPGLPDSDYPFPGLCGAAVAFKLAWALCQQACGEKKVTDRMRNFLMEAVGLAALGTVADVVPLIDENRILVRHGLNSLTHSPPLGVEALLKQTKLGDKRQLEGEDLGFSLAPRLNAAGRLGHAEIGVELLTTEDSARAEKLAQYIDELNEERKSLERSMLLSADKQAKEKFDPLTDPALVLADHQWHAGVIGIVAGRLAEKYNIPTILIAGDPIGVKPGIGSARSAGGLNLHWALAECDEHLRSHGGHAAAAGMRIIDKNVPAFRRAFCDVVRREISNEDRMAELSIDAEAALSGLTKQTVQQIESLAPFGHGNRRPVLCASNVRLDGAPKRIGASGRHLSMTFDQHGVKLRAVAFGGGDWADELAAIDGELSIAFRPVINHFRGRSTVELHLDDWRAEEG
ncbi:single-stranded-DNA-specific exonuclease RecJ [Adhaeretor mobilis]|uniref:Single-stranded-DNA-specific exonuclease RecJ n=1 Tax=Adhaeretor mobilis TaxID=1930276 RepID=A0A517MTK5_9BACT|nr:single-stranded-DNA-specific exonuclease RecJ [Adhaeretor mobilis]QDS98117.1 Single-stranded-DNA-specific exonuclease RecJ [Adhaeretor mobilis]